MFGKISKKMLWPVIFIGCILFLRISSVSGRSMQQLQQEQESLQATEQATQEKLDETKEELAKVMNEINVLVMQIDEIEAELGRINDRLDKTNGELYQTEIELKKAEELLEEHYETLKLRVKYMHENGAMGYLKVIIHSNDVSDFLNRVQYIQDIMAYDQKMFKKLETTEELIKQKKEDIVVQKTEIENLAAQEEEKKENLEDNMDKKEQIVAQLEEDEKLYEQKIKELEDASNEVEQLIKKAQAAQAAQASRSMPAVYTGGQLGWPVPGYYTRSSGYVNRVNPVTGKREFHTGVDIPAPKGTHIVAAADGVVTTSGWLGGYGNTIMINHGGGLYTLYGHNSSLVVSVGEYVSKGQTVALCGSTGISTGNHCHFEVRLNGSHTDPMPYLQ